VNGTAIWIVIGVIGVAAVALSLWGGPTAPKPAPDFSLANLDGEIVTLSSLRGNVILLDFWASWCKPCKTTFPQLHALQQRYAERGVVLLTVSLDRDGERARTYMAENGFSVDRVLWGSLEEARVVRELFGVGGIPRTLVIDRQGFVRFSGYPTSLTVEHLERWL
jgi:thiol-disulfide isomerase/thioredoxin